MNPTYTRTSQARDQLFARRLRAFHRYHRGRTPADRLAAYRTWQAACRTYQRRYGTLARQEVAI